ncbi:MAG TPA: hypothetical protein VF777_08805 [Phycisphaerales bacterium]
MMLARRSSLVGRYLVRLTAVVAVLSLAGCTTIDDIRREYSTREEDLERTLDKLLRSCEQSPNPATCKEEQRAWYRQALKDLDDARRKAIDGLWQEAEQRRKAWDDAIRKKLEEQKLPDIKDALPRSSISTSLQLRRTTIGLNSPEAQSGSFIQSSAGGGVVFDPPCLTTSLDVSGPASFVRDGVTVSGYVGGTLTVCWDATAEPGSLIGEITGGSLSLSVPGLPYIELAVDTSVLERSITASESGTGRFSTWFNITTPSLPLSAIIRDRVWIDLPVTFSETDDFLLSLNNAPVDSLVPRYRSPFSDYNRDGSLVWSSDYAAFLAAWTSHDIAADRNRDDAWTQADIDRWTAEFNRDVAP